MTTPSRLQRPAIEIEIRALTGTDAAVFWRFRLDALEQEPQAFGESAEEHRRTSVAVTASRLDSASSGNFVLGAFVGGRLVGTVGFYRGPRIKQWHKGHVWGVYVHKRHRARGIARRLLSELIDRAKAEPGLEQLTLTVGQHQDAAKRLYASLGFEIFAHEPRALKVGDSYVDEDYMLLRLRSNRT